MLWNRLIGSAPSLLPATSIQFVGGKAVGNNAPKSPWVVSLTDLTGGIGTQPQAGDIVIVYFGVATSADIGMEFSTPGFTELYESYVAGASGTNTMVGYKVMSSTPDTTVALTSPATSRGWSIGILVFRGVDQATPFDVTRNSATGTSSLPDPRAITPITDGAVVVVGAVGGVDGGVSGVFTSPGSLGFNSAVGTLSNASVVGLGYGVWGGGSFDPAAFSCPNPPSSWAAVTLALRPA